MLKNTLCIGSVSVFISYGVCANPTCLTTYTAKTDNTVGYREQISETAEILELNWSDVLNARVQEADRLGLFAQKRRERQKVFETLATEPKSLGLARSENDRTDVFELTRYQALGQEEAWLRAIASFKRTYLFVDLADALQRDWIKVYLNDTTNRFEQIKVIAVG